MNSIKTPPDAFFISFPAKTMGTDDQNQDNKTDNFMGLTKRLNQVSNFSMKMSTKLIPSAVALTQCFSALLFFSMPLAEARNLPRGKKNQGRDYEAIGKNLHRASLQLRDEKNVPHQKQSNGKMRIKNMPQAITAGLYHASALSSSDHNSDKLGHRKDHSTYDNVFSASPYSSVIAARTEKSTEQLPQFNPNEFYMISGYGDNADRLVPLKQNSQNIEQNFLIYNENAEVLTPWFDPSDSPRDASLVGRSALHKSNRKRPKGQEASTGQKGNILAKVKNANIRHLSYFPHSTIGPRQQAGIIQQCKTTLAEDEYGIAVNNLNPAHYGQGKIYEVFNYRDGINQPVARFYVLINAEPISVRPAVMPEHGVKYEMFDAENQTVSYPLACSNGQWMLQQPTALQAAKSLIRRITPTMVDPTLEEAALSAPDARGLQWTHDHKSYLRIKGRYVELIQNKNKSNRYHIKTEHKRKRMHIKFQNNKFIVCSQRNRAKYNIFTEKRQILIY